MTRIAHLTSVHQRYDTRIFLKQCRSLAAVGHEVILVVADGQGEERRDGVRIVDVGGARGRLGRMLGVTRRVLSRALALDAEIYHLHDPELLLAGLALKRHGKRVVFDAHEDLPRQVLSKPYLHPRLRRPIAAGADVCERFACRRVDAVVAATPAIRDKFIHAGIRSVDINNYPMLGELASEHPAGEKERAVCYIGGLTSIRGIREMIAAIGLSADVRLNLAGTFAEAGLKAGLQATAGWASVNELGFLTRPEIRDVLGRSVAGLVTLHPTPAYLDALPVKMFEYMAAGIAVIASHFPLWREIVEGNDCGICVDPLDPTSIAAAINRLADDPALARRMGENGRRAVEERYNWTIEERKLLALYQSLATPPQSPRPDR